MKRQAAVIFAALLVLTQASCSTDNGNGGVFGTIRAIIEDTEEVTETVTTEASSEEKTTAADISQSDDQPVDFVLKCVTRISQGADTKIEFDGKMKDIAGYSDIHWLFGSGETFEKSIPVEVVGGKIKSLDIREIVFEEMTDGAASGKIDYWVFLAGERDGIVYVLSNVIESCIVFRDDTGGDEDVPSLITAEMAADDLAHEPGFLDNMRVCSSDGTVFKARPAKTDFEYYYGDDADESGFHIVMTPRGVVQCIDSSGKYDGSKVYIAVMQDGTDISFIMADLENGNADIHAAVGAEEGIYSVFVVDDVNGFCIRRSNILEYELIKAE